MGRFQRVQPLDRVRFESGAAVTTPHLPHKRALCAYWDVQPARTADAFSPYPTHSSTFATARSSACRASSGRGGSGPGRCGTSAAATHATGTGTSTRTVRTSIAGLEAQADRSISEPAAAARKDVPDWRNGRDIAKARNRYRARCAAIISTPPQQIHSPRTQARQSAVQTHCAPDRQSCPPAPDCASPQP